VSEPAPPTERPVSSPGPTVSVAFNLGKIADQGEDSDPILRDGPDLGLIGVFDGMGGAGGTVYDTDDGPRTGAYLASRIARDVVERRMLDLLEPDWNLNGSAAADDLHHSVQRALQDRLAELKAPPSGLRSRLLRALPTTMAVAALQRTQLGGSTWACHVFWSGDSRAYAFTPTGARQLSTDDLRDPVDAMANLRQDSVVSNAVSADTDFVVQYRRIELVSPFLIACATDGCFGYLPSPMHFEHLVLGSLCRSRNADAWSASLQAAVGEVTGDDAAISMLGVGAGFADLRTLFAPRVDQLEDEFIRPLDALGVAVAAAERELAEVRRQHVSKTAEIWARYRPDYERYLNPEPELDDEAVTATSVTAEIDPGSAAGEPTDAADVDSATAEPSSESEPAAEIGHTR